jgi:hypothetical protein
MLWLILAGVFTLMSIASVGVARYQLPMYPIMSVLAAVPCVLLWQRVTTRLIQARQVAQRPDEQV